MGEGALAKMEERWPFLEMGRAVSLWQLEPDTGAHLFMQPAGIPAEVGAFGASRRQILQPEGR